MGATWLSGYKKPDLILKRFTERTPNRPDEGCWLWAGRLDPNGYPKQGNKWGHRLAYQINVGPIPEGMEIEHVCEVPQCVRWTYDPALGSPHIQAVSHRQNIQRAMDGGRFGRPRRTA